MKLQNGRERRCHQDQIRIRAATGESALEESETGDASEMRDNQSSEIFIDLPSANSSAATECSSPTSEVSTATANQDSSPLTSSAQIAILNPLLKTSQEVISSKESKTTSKVTTRTH